MRGRGAKRGEEAGAVFGAKKIAQRIKRNPFPPSKKNTIWGFFRPQFVRDFWQLWISWKKSHFFASNLDASSAGFFSRENSWLLMGKTRIHHTGVFFPSLKMVVTLLPTHGSLFVQQTRHFICLENRAKKINLLISEKVFDRIVDDEKTQFLFLTQKWWLEKRKTTLENSTLDSPPPPPLYCAQAPAQNGPKRPMMGGHLGGANVQKEKWPQILLVQIFPSILGSKDRLGGHIGGIRWNTHIRTIFKMNFP